MCSPRACDRNPPGGLTSVLSGVIAARPGSRCGVSEVVQAGGCGLPAGSALLPGEAFGYGLRVPQKVITLVMAFGAGCCCRLSPTSWSGKPMTRAARAPRL